MAPTAISAVKETINEPIVTGALLYLLTRGPVSLRQRILSPFQTNLLSKNGAARLAGFITVLKILTSVGVIRRANTALNALAWNKWNLFSGAGTPFKFGPEKEELIIITGGSSGFGYEMVKGFTEYARVVVLDVMDIPQELAECKCNCTKTIQKNRTECLTKKQ